MKDLLTDINHQRSEQTNTRLVLCQPSNLLFEYSSTQPSNAHNSSTKV